MQTMILPTQVTWPRSATFSSQTGLSNLYPRVTYILSCFSSDSLAEYSPQCAGKHPIASHKVALRCLSTFVRFQLAETHTETTSIVQPLSLTPPLTALSISSQYLQ